MKFSRRQGTRPQQVLFVGNRLQGNVLLICKVAGTKAPAWQ
jgi:hypothetical protein